MKTKFTRKIFLEVTLNSSEAVMFNQGGKHTINLSSDILHFFNAEGDPINSDVELSIQLERNCQGRFDHIMDAARQHKASVNNGCV